jgi:enoyl-CoA hydratase
MSALTTLHCISRYYFRTFHTNPLDMKHLLIDPHFSPHVALITLNRPKELNALNAELMESLRETLLALDKDDAIRVIIITGNEQAFAAGADIKQMADKSTIDMLAGDQLGTWDQVKKTRKPIIAAVSGFALGGGCELAMMCDLIIASETAKFGQPEIKIGVIPGAGGTQRLTKAVGKAKAMELILTGKFITAEEALHFGLVNKIVPVPLLLDEAKKLALEIAANSPIAVALAKDAINRSFETSLEEGLRSERKNFYLTFASADKQEGMAAFIEKRKPLFKGK